MNSLRDSCLVDWIKSFLWLANSFFNSFTSNKRWHLGNMLKKSWWYNNSSTNSKWCNRLWLCNNKDQLILINISKWWLDLINRDLHSEIMEWCLHKTSTLSNSNQHLLEGLHLPNISLSNLFSHLFLNIKTSILGLEGKCRWWCFLQNNKFTILLLTCNKSSNFT